MTVLDVTNWLSAHSDRVQKTEREVVYTHFTGETSVLALPPQDQRERLRVRSPFLSTFYASFSAASLGNGHIVFASNVPGGVQGSHGYTVLDLRETRQHAQECGMQCEGEEEVFMQTAGWMFLYSIRPALGEKEELRLYDRDFQKTRSIGDLREVLEEWWSIVLEDR